MHGVERIILTQDWVTGVLVACLILLTLARLMYENRFVDFAALLVNDKYLLKTSKEIKFEDTFNILLFIIQLLSVSVFIYLIIRYFNFLSNLEPSVAFIRIALCYGVFVGVKFLLERILGVLFDGEQELARYHYYKLSYRNYFAVLLIPVNALIAYAFEPGITTVSIIIGILLLLNGFSLFKAFSKHENLIYNNLFYFILYICALEIAPYFILFKVLSAGVN